VEYSGNKCWCCARLKSAIIELESAIETIRKLRELYIRDAFEVMNNAKSMQNKCIENDLPYSDKHQFQDSDGINKTCNGINDDSVILMGEVVT
jgi:hypothetical protein